MERRILITHWAGTAWQKIRLGNQSQIIRNTFQRTGSLITADGSDNHLIA